LARRVIGVAYVESLAIFPVTMSISSTTFVSMLGLSKRPYQDETTPETFSVK
jgi:hypothetical protein